MQGEKKPCGWHKIDVTNQEMVYLSILMSLIFAIDILTLLYNVIIPILLGLLIDILM